MKKLILITVSLSVLLTANHILSMDTFWESVPTSNLNKCLLPTNDHAEYITEQPGWPNNTSPFNPESDGKKFKQIWLNSTAKKQKLNQQEDFLLGLSSSAYQIEGGLDKNNATADFYSKKNLPTAGNAIDFWNRYEDDIKQMKTELGINSFRLSIAWDRVQPTQGYYDEEAINRYLTIIKTCKSYNIEPIITLHQYTIPTWFAQLGGFEKPENSTHFIEFAKKMYVALHEQVRYWSTFNAPEAYAIKGYAKAENSPGIKDNWQKVEEVLINMLDAHVSFYQAIKGQNGLYSNYKNKLDVPEPLIGIQKNIIMLDSANKTFEHTCLSPINDACCTVGNMLQNDVFYSFFKTGIAKVWVPLKADILHPNPLAPKSVDWIGINFYSNMFMHKMEPLEETDSDRITENPRYRNYPEGIARAIEQIHSTIAEPLNIPIIITENGIATQKNSDGELKRKRFFQRALFTVQILLQRGYNIIGYLPWSSHDSYEWPTEEAKDPFTKRLFGFFEVDLVTYNRKLKESSYYYRDFINGYNANK